MLKQKFIDLISKYSIDSDFNIKCWNEIETNYSLKARHYHTLKHLEFMLIELENVKHEVEQSDTLLFSIFYHDIIYKATKSDNEHKSALFFKNIIKHTTFNKAENVFNQIEATKQHELSSSRDTNILLDLDLSVLGQSSEIYKMYSINIRKEYKIYPDFMYNKGRVKVLKHLSNLTSIYKTEFFLDSYESQAQTNLKNELEELRSK